MDSPNHPLPPNRLSECEEQVDDDQVKDYGQLFKETADDECCNEPDTVKIYQTEGTPFISHASSATDLRELGATGIDASKSNTSKMPSGHNGNGELSTKSTNGNVKQLYTVHEHDIDYTPMIFSRNSSVSSLESLDCPLDVNDADSVASEFSRRSESQAVSPSDLPDSPGEPIQEKPSVSSQSNNMASVNGNNVNKNNATTGLTSKNNNKNGSAANSKPHPPPLPPKPLAFKRCSLPPARLPNYESVVVNNVDFNEESPKVFGVEGTPAAMSHATSISELSFISHENHPVSASGSPSGSDDEAGTAMIQKCLNVGLKTSAAGQWSSTSSAKSNNNCSSNSVENYATVKFNGRPERATSSISNSSYSPVATVARCSSSNELQSKHLTSTANYQLTNSPPELPPRRKSRPVPPPRRSLIKPSQHRSPASSTRSAPIFSRKESKFILNYQEMPTNEITLPPPADFADLSEVDTVQVFNTEDTPAQLSQATSISDLSFSMYSFNLSSDRQLCEIEQENVPSNLPVIEPPPINDDSFNSVPLDKVPSIEDEASTSSITLPMAQLHVSTSPGLATSTTTSTSVINADHESSCNSIQSPPVPSIEDEALSESEYALIQRCFDLGIKRVSESSVPLLASTQSKKPLPQLPDDENQFNRDSSSLMDKVPSSSFIATANTQFNSASENSVNNNNHQLNINSVNNNNNNINSSNSSNNNNQIQIENSNSNSAMTKANANLLTNLNATLSSNDSSNNHSHNSLLIEHRAVSRNSDDNNNGSKRLGTSSTYSTLTRRRKGYLETDIDSIANYEEYMKAQQVNNDADPMTNYEEFVRHQQQSKDTFV